MKRLCKNKGGKIVAKIDMMDNVIYILVNTREQNVIAHGITFDQFIQSLPTPLTNLLLLKQQRYNGEYHFHTKLSFVLNEQLENLIKNGSYKSSEFCWVDFEDVFSLDTIEGQELAELLYLGHMKKHLSLPFFQKLNNRFAYLTDVDGWLNKIYFRYWSDFYSTLGGVLGNKFNSIKLEKSLINFRKRKDYPPVDQKVLYQLNTLFTEGIVFSFHHITQNRTQTILPFWVVGDYYDMDEMNEQFLEVSKENADGHIIFDKKQKEWAITIHS